VGEGGQAVRVGGKEGPERESKEGPDGRDSMRIEPVFLFDLDGTLVDSVYQHVLAWNVVDCTASPARSVFQFL
jgi:hypothetical protein